MTIYAFVENNRIYQVELEKCSLKTYQFFGNLEHLLTHKEMYYIIGDEIKLNPNFETEQREMSLLRNLEFIRDKRKPLLKAFDTLEMKRKFILDGFIAVGEFPFIDSMSNERWIEIKIWRDVLRDLTEDLLNYQFPETPLEVKQFI